MPKGTRRKGSVETLKMNDGEIGFNVKGAKTKSGTYQAARRVVGDKRAQRAVASAQTKKSGMGFETSSTPLPKGKKAAPKKPTAKKAAPKKAVSKKPADKKKK